MSRDTLPIIDELSITERAADYRHGGAERKLYAFEAKVSALPASMTFEPTEQAENAAATNDRTPIVSFFIISASFVSFNSGLSDADTPKAENAPHRGIIIFPAVCAAA